MAVSIATGNSTYIQRSSGISPVAPFTISGWFQLNAQNTSGDPIIIGWIQDTATSSQYILVYDRAPECRGGYGGTNILASGSILTTGQWYHIVGVFGGTAGSLTSCKVYINGALINTATGSVTTPTFSAPFACVASAGSGTTYGTAGNPVAEVAFWNVALSAAEISALYFNTLNCGIGPQNFSSANLLSYVSLDQTSGSISDNFTSGITWAITGTGITTSADPYTAPVPALPSNVAQVGYALGSGTLTSIAAVLYDAQTAGNTNVAFLDYGAPGSNTASVSDSNGAYTSQVGIIKTTAGNKAGYIFYRQNIAAAAAGANTVTATITGSGGNNPELFVIELSGIPTSGIIDVSGSEKTTTNTGNGASALTTTNAADLILDGFATPDNGWTAPGTGFTLLANPNATNGSGSIFNFRKVSSTGTYTDTPTNNGTNLEWLSLAVAIKLLSNNVNATWSSNPKSTVVLGATRIAQDAWSANPKITLTLGALRIANDTLALNPKASFTPFAARVAESAVSFGPKTTLTLGNVAAAPKTWSASPKATLTLGDIVVAPKSWSANPRTGLGFGALRIAKTAITFSPKTTLTLGASLGGGGVVNATWSATPKAALTVAPLLIHNATVVFSPKTALGLSAIGGNVATNMYAPYLNVGVGRETIYSALANHLQTVLQIPVIRGWPPGGAPDVATSTVAWIFQNGGKTRTQVGLPPIYVDRAMLVVKILQQTAGITPATALNNMRDQLDVALSCDNLQERVCTLGGLVRYCWVTGDWYVETQAGGWTDFRSTIEFQYFSQYNQ